MFTNARRVPIPALATPFIERPELQDAMDKVFTKHRQQKQPSQLRYLIHGLDGAGKTQMALNFLHRRRSEYVSDAFAHSRFENADTAIGSKRCSASTGVAKTPSALASNEPFNPLALRMLIAQRMTHSNSWDTSRTGPSYSTISTILLLT